MSLQQWLWPRHIPSGLELSREEYLDIKKAAKRLRKKNPGYRNAFLKDVSLYAMFMLPIFAAWVFVLFRPSSLPGPLFPVLIAAGFYSPIMAWWTARYTFAPFIRRALCEAGHEVCLECGYLLMGLPDCTLQCPECGAIRVNRKKAQEASKSGFGEPLPKYRWD